MYDMYATHKATKSEDFYLVQGFHVN
jgi:hypothetical protein